ncbi:MAG: hypothetical protein AVDCRST_MAG49-437 [uncultured Thermomicrobiales bacterium]|uniref:Uncharacterized protein n=1 Tax=uncultured Thermomicrobiales bacterium TaxID=1645740 RepID=A0A6J4U0T3_9BACT|nr:MAG: hypothetical protein AVDCRST_MAG49-437 [uncultured Thermomicrobiales bacterium]
MDSPRAPRSLPDRPDRPDRPEANRASLPNSAVGPGGAARRDAGALGARLAAIAVVAALVWSLVPLGGTGRAQDDADDNPLVGEYAATFTDEEIPLGLIGGPSLTGDWVIVFGTGGAYEVRRQDLGTVVTGSYAVDGQTVEVTDEGGVLSCANPQPNGLPAETGIYTFQITGGRLTLRAVEDGCATRAFLFTTRALAPFVACATVPLALSAEPAVPNAEGEGSAALDEIEEEVGPGAGGETAQDETPAADEDDDSPAASPVASPAAGTPGAGEAGSATPAPAAAIGTDEDPEAAIDDLLSQLTACWATGDPARILPLFSPQLLDELTGGGSVSLREVADQLLAIQTVPITWERAGDIELTNDEESEAEAIVALRIGAEETFETLEFVLTDDGWRFVTFLAPA